ncbi:DUF3263 domain-containing protein [Knoellia sp. LjRoot47]|uniref:DUF3263 domain-containing protein n=1 Tax=Knoellia sp. LjRoot47 TaxID=3342330 RepID=UPI003ED12545
MTPQDEQLLEAIGEHLNRGRDGRLESVMAERTGLSAVRSWQRVNALLDDAEAWAAYPIVMGVLRSRRDRGRRCAA